MTIREEIIRHFDDDDWMDQKMAGAVRGVMRDHKRRGIPVSTWEDGKVVLIPPDEIVLPDVDCETRGNRGLKTITSFRPRSRSKIL